MANPNYMPSTLLGDANALTVSQIILAAHSPFPSTAGGDIYVNHWVIYLNIAQGGSIRLDMSPNSNAGQPGTLIAKRLDYNVSADVVYQIPFPAVKGLYARHVLDRIVQNGRHKYRYGDKMLECRYWAYVVMEDFRNAGYIGGTGAEAWSAVSSSWTTGGAQLQKTPAMTQGTFG